MAFSVDIKSGQLLHSFIKGKTFNLDKSTQISFPENPIWKSNIVTNGTISFVFEGTKPTFSHSTDIVNLSGTVHEIIFNGTTCVLKVSSFYSLGMTVSLQINSDWKIQ